MGSPPVHVCSVCAHAHREAIDARLLSKKEDGSNEHSGNAVAAWMTAEGWTAPLARTLNRHRLLHLGVTEHVAKRAVAAAKAKAAGEAPPVPEPLAPAVEAAIAVEGANIAALDEWSADLAVLRKHLIAKALGKLPGGPARLPSENKPQALEPQEVSFLVHGGRATALLAATRNQILTGGKGNRGGLGNDDQQKGLKELVEGLKNSPPPIEGDRADNEPAPTKEEIEASLAEVGGVEVQGQAFGPDVAAEDEDEDAEIRGPSQRVIDMPTAPDSGPKATTSAGEPPVPYVYKPPPLRLVAK
jgi:hypothetical protein